jgi:hypothetical protein
MKSLAGRTLRDDFYSSRVAVIFLDPQTMADNWAVPELSHYVKSHPLIIYATADTPEQEIAKLKLPVPIVFVHDEAEFERDLNARLKQMMS